MKLDNDKTGQDVVFLLKQQRNLYHQLRNLAEKQSKIMWADASPEELVRILEGRRKLIEKLREVNSKLKPIRANWQTIKVKLKAPEIVQVQELAMSVSSLVIDLKQIANGKEQSKDILSDTAHLAEEFASEI